MRRLIETTWTPCGCEVCGAGPTGLRTLGERRGRFAQRQHDYAWQHRDVQCDRCGFVFNALRPEAGFLRDYYADCWPIASSSVTIVPDYSLRTRLELLARWLKPGAKLYEIGDKLGEFHAALGAAGFTVVGDDVMAGGSERAGWLDGLFRRGDAAVPPAGMREAFDAVLAYFVVEHLANPQSWLRSIRGCLKDGGLLVIEVPHFASHPKEGLMHEHFLYLTPESLTKLVNHAGYDVVEVQETAASRPFGFALVARRTAVATPIEVAAMPGTAATLSECYRRGRELLDVAEENLSSTARLVAEAVSGAENARVCFFGANQTASEIAAHLRCELGDAPVAMIAYDNSDVKRGVQLPGFTVPVETPTPDAFDFSLLHVCVICSRGWTRQIADQIRAFELPRVVLIDGAAARRLPAIDVAEAA